MVEEVEDSTNVSDEEIFVAAVPVVAVAFQRAPMVPSSGAPVVTAASVTVSGVEPVVTVALEVVKFATRFAVVAERSSPAVS